MKRIDSLCAALTVSLISGLTVGQDVHMDSFESDALGSFPSGWTSRFSGGGTEVSNVSASEGSNSVRMVGQPFGANENYTNDKFSFSSGLVTLSCSINVAEFPQNSDGCAGASVSYFGPNWSVGFGIGQVEAGGGLKISGTNIDAVPGHWYHFMLVADGDAGTADLYLDGVLVRDDFALDTALSSGSDRYLSVAFHTGCINTGQIVSYFDALRIQGKQCMADINGDHILDLNDVTGFVNGFMAGCP